MTDEPSDAALETDAWWVVSQEAMLWLLRRCHNGEDPEMVYAEVYANFMCLDDEP